MEGNFFHRLVNNTMINDQWFKNFFLLLDSFWRDRDVRPPAPDTLNDHGR
jgi:hypothetical protein